jgi:tetratricopeptide (TPR) repeat protein
MPLMNYEPLHHTIVAMDVAGSGILDDPLQLQIRADLHDIVAAVLAGQSLNLRDVHVTDLGDGLRLIVPPAISPRYVLDPFIANLATALKARHKISGEVARLRLRMAVHMGLVHRDGYGWAGQALVHCARLLDAAQVRNALAAANGADLVVVISHALYEAMVRHGYGLNPGACKSVEISEKETTTTAWIYVPGWPTPPGFDDSPADVGQNPVEPGHVERSPKSGTLRSDRENGNTDRGDVRLSGSRVVPQQLPAAVPLFVGRTAELDLFTGLVNEMDKQRRASVIAAIHGPAGVGKTTAAVYLAHLVAHRFPDGQLYMNLHGFDQTGLPIEPAKALQDLLNGLGVLPERIPVGTDARAGLYRTLLNGRRVLILLDNAVAAEQVRPLLPGSSGCLVIVTSRNQLTSLIADGAVALTLELFTAAEARDFLALRLGHTRVAAHPEAVDEIIGLCARLPLALSIVAARAAMRPAFSAAALASELRMAYTALDAFDDSDPVLNIRAIFSWSYNRLSDEAATLFRVMGMYSGEDIGTPAAASLGGIPIRQARMQLAELTRTHIVEERAPDRFAIHDLLRAYATELVHSLDSEAEQRLALRRLLDYYLHTAYAASKLLFPHRDLIVLPSDTQPGVVSETLCSPAEALNWFTIEHSALLGALRLAAGSGLDNYVLQFAWAMAVFFVRQGHWHDWVAAQNAALDVAQRIADKRWQAYLHRDLAGAFQRLGQHDQAHTHYGRALDMYGELDDLVGQAHTRRYLAHMLGIEGHHHVALAHARQALALFLSAGHRVGEARALNAIGWHNAQLGNYRRAFTHCHRAIALLGRIGDSHLQAQTWYSLGYSHRHCGHQRQATSCYQRAADLYKDTGDRYYEALARVYLGDTYCASGHLAAARRAWQDALTLLDQLHHPDADQVRTRLNDHLGDLSPLAGRHAAGRGLH